MLSNEKKKNSNLYYRTPRRLTILISPKSVTSVKYESDIFYLTTTNSLALKTKMKFQTIKTNLRDRILTVTFNRSEKKNAINNQVMLEVTEILKDASPNNEVDFVILTGAGDFYSSGADLKETDVPIEDRIKVGRECVDTLIDFPKLLIALVNGPAVGFAVTTLALCDLVYCSTKATFWVPFTTHGLSAEGCSSYLFPKIMGSARANEIIQLGRKFTATEAKEWGFVSDIYEPEELQTVLLPKIQRLRESIVPESVEANKRLIRNSELKTLHEVNAAEWKELRKRFESPEFLDAVIKFSNRKSTENKL